QLRGAGRLSTRQPGVARPLSGRQRLQSSRLRRSGQSAGETNAGGVAGVRVCAKTSGGVFRKYPTGEGTARPALGGTASPPVSPCLSTAIFYYGTYQSPNLRSKCAFECNWDFSGRAQLPARHFSVFEPPRQG